MLTTITCAARTLGIDRRTVQRYARKFPQIMTGNQIDWVRLKDYIDFAKQCDGRGYPLERKRGKRLPLGDLAKKPAPFIRLTVSQRLEVIARHIELMTDAEQVAVLRMIPGMFRTKNLEKAYLRADSERTGQQPDVPA